MAGIERVERRTGLTGGFFADFQRFTYVADCVNVMTEAWFREEEKQSK